jgi:Protein of unknown function (DUF2815)
MHKPPPVGHWYFMKELKMSNTRVITGTVRASYAKVMRAEPNRLNGKNEYSVMLLIPKEDADTLGKLKAAAKSAIELKFGSMPPKGLRNPIKDGDTATKEDGSPMGSEFKGHMFLNVKCDADKHRPSVIDANGNELIDPDAVVSGDYIRVSLNAFAYDQAGNKGVGFGLNNVQLVKKGAPLGGTRMTAAEEFGVQAKAATTAVTDDDWA